MTLDHLWAGWRRTYIESVTDGPGAAEHVEATPVPEGEGSLFERILRLPDDEAFVVHRGRTCAALLNAYPYTNGHVLVLPKRAVPDLGSLTDDEHTELWVLVRAAVQAVETAYRCDGVNVGMNLGHAAGAGVPDHVHAHVLPRWNGDTNFMTAVAETRVMPETLGSSWRKLRDAWPPA